MKKLLVVCVLSLISTNATASFIDNSNTIGISQQDYNGGINIFQNFRFNLDGSYNYNFMIRTLVGDCDLKYVTISGVNVGVTGFSDDGGACNFYVNSQKGNEYVSKLLKTKNNLSLGGGNYNFNTKGYTKTLNRFLKMDRVKVL